MKTNCGIFSQTLPRHGLSWWTHEEKADPENSRKNKKLVISIELYFSFKIDETNLN